MRAVMRTFLVFLLAVNWGGALFSQESDFKPHPSLVKLDAANCVTCHDDLQGKKTVHPVLKDSGCDSCHEMKKVEKKTMVGLVEQGNALCLTCHSSIEEAMGKKYPHAVLEDGCENCHQPHSSDFPKLLNASPAAVCAECHDITDDAFKNKHGRQPVDRLGCSSCHEPHGSDQAKLLTGKVKHAPFEGAECNACHKRARGAKIRLRSDGSKLCFACHSDKEEEFKKESVHHPIKTEGCSSCHDPHMSDNKYMLKGKGNKLCLDCHKDIQGLMTGGYTHPPAEEGCLDCHGAHATNQPYLLTDNSTTLCLNCHDGEDQTFLSKHFKQPADSLTCSECHNPHGAKTKTLTNTSMHPPYSEKECDSCHEGVGDDRKLTFSADSINEMCLMCHDDKAEDDSKKDMIKHGALEDDCTVCHSAHASGHHALLKDKTPRLCISCHDDIGDHLKKKPYTHGIIDSHGCQACHDSHYAKNEKLLYKTPNELCVACHVDPVTPAVEGKATDLFGEYKMDAATFKAIKKIFLTADLSMGHPQRGHVVAGNISKKTLKNKRIKGLTFTGTLTCLSCHDAHAGMVEQLFPDNITGRFQLCTKCHKK